MYFATYLENKVEKVGVLKDDGSRIIDLAIIFNKATITTMLNFIAYCTDDKLKEIEGYLENANSNDGIAIEDVKIIAPIPEPRRNVICLGLNYKDHAEELKNSLGEQAQIPKVPVYFTKMTSYIIGNNDKINRHVGITNEIDYEVELAVIIGKEGTNIPKENAEEYIFGYTILNDVSARDLQKSHSQWIRGKSLDTFTSMGPYIVHKSQLPLPLTLNLTCKVNDELRQSSNTKNLIFDIPYIISDLSRGTTLKPGDIIATGTPAGVGMGFNPPKYLGTGDSIVCTIEGIGTLINKVSD